MKLLKLKYLNMKYFLTLIILIIGFTGLYFLENKPQRNDSSANQSVVQDPDSVIRYISENISSLSPEKEQLGGTFYVTNITLDSGSGVVQYEYGHNAHSAKFEYSYTSDVKVAVSNFLLVE